MTGNVPVIWLPRVMVREVVEAPMTVAATPPIRTVLSLVVAENPVPVMTAVAPACPSVGLMLVTEGVAAVEKVKVIDGYVTPFDVTATLTSPATCTDVSHSMVVADSMVTLQVSPSIVTVELALNPCPVMVTSVPP